MVYKNGQFNIWRIVVIAVVAAIISVGGWVFSEVRDLPVTYETIEFHKVDIKDIKKDIDKWDDKLQTQQTRIEAKIDETNTFLRNHFANKPTN